MQCKVSKSVAYAKANFSASNKLSNSMIIYEWQYCHFELANIYISIILKVVNVIQKGPCHINVNKMVDVDARQMLVATSVLSA